MVYVQIHFGKLYVYTPSKIYFWERIQISIFTELSRLDKLQILQRLWLPLLKYSTGWTFILMFHNLFACIIKCPFAQLALKCSLFIIFWNSFVPSMHCKIIHWLSNPLIYELIITFYLSLIYALMIRRGEALQPLLL